MTRIKPDFKFDAIAAEILQCASEALVDVIFNDVFLVAIHDRRYNLTGEDFKVAEALSDKWGDIRKPKA